MARKVNSRRALSIQQKNKLKSSASHKRPSSSNIQIQSQQQLNSPNYVSGSYENSTQNSLTLLESSINKQHSLGQRTHLRHSTHEDGQCFCFLRKGDLFLPPGYEYQHPDDDAEDTNSNA